MLDEIDNPYIPSVHKSQEQAPAEITARLLSLATATPSMITAEEHGRQLRNVITSYNDAQEMTRRELCKYGIAVGTIADQAVKDLIEIRVVGEYILGVIQNHTDSMGLDAHGRVLRQENEESFGPLYEVSPEPSGEHGEGEGKDRTSAGEHGEGKGKDKASAGSTLPGMLLKSVFGAKAHRCRCSEVCEPTIDNTLRQQALTQLRSERVQAPEEEEEQKIHDDFRARHSLEIHKEVRARITREAMNILRAEAKDSIREELTATITAQLQAECDEKVSQAVLAKFDDVDKQLRPATAPGTSS